MIRALLALALWIISSPAFAAVQNCTFAWNARTEADLAGYKIRWGTTSGVYPNTVTLGVDRLAGNCVPVRLIQAVGLGRFPSPLSRRQRHAHAVGNAFGTLARDGWRLGQLLGDVSLHSPIGARHSVEPRHDSHYHTPN